MSSWVVTDTTTFELELRGHKQATAQAHVRPHCVWLNFEHTKNSNPSKNNVRSDEIRTRICQLIKKNEIARIYFRPHSKTNTDHAKMGVFFARNSMCTSKTPPSWATNKDEASTLRTQGGKMRNYRVFRWSFINTESCAKASAPRLDVSSLTPTTPPWGRPTEEQVIRNRTYQNIRGKNNRQVPQARVFENNVLQPSTKLKAETVQTASYFKRQPFELCMKV